MLLQLSLALVIPPCYQGSDLMIKCMADSDFPFCGLRVYIQILPNCLCHLTQDVIFFQCKLLDVIIIYKFLYASFYSF